MKKNIHPFAAAAAVQLVGLAAATAASVNLVIGTPDAGDGVSNLNTSTSDADNTAHGFVGSDYIGFDQRGGDLEVGQSFTTGSAAGGYLLNSVSVKQVSWTSDWDFDGGSITMRVFSLPTGNEGQGVWSASELVSETVSMEPNSTSPTIGGDPDDNQWLTFNFTAPVALSADSLYAFSVGATGGPNNEEFYMILDGNANPALYADGFSITVPETSDALWDGGAGGQSDRAFVANMTIVPEPSIALLGGLGLLGLLRRRR